MTDTGFDRALTSWTGIGLDGLIGLDGGHELVIGAREIRWVALRRGGLERWHGPMVGRRTTNHTIAASE
jgi:hypothetical protein